MNRREFLAAGLSAGIVNQRAQASQIWGGPVLDVHLHTRPDPEGVYNHIPGSGEAGAVLPGGRDSGTNAKESMQAHPGRFVRFTRADVTRPDAIAQMTQALKDGAIGLGEIKYHVALNGPEMRRVYELASEARVPVTVHFQKRRILKANASADVPKNVAYSSGRIKPGWHGQMVPSFQTSTETCPGTPATIVFIATRTSCETSSIVTRTS